MEKCCKMIGRDPAKEIREMRFVSFSTKELPKPHLGLVRDNEVVDVDLAGQALGVTVPDQMLDLIDQYEQFKAALQAILEKTGERRFTQVKTFTDIGAAHVLSEVQLAAPITSPRKNIMCMAVNYSEHATATAQARGRALEEPSVPILFT